ncbi:kinesin-like protein KIN-7N [Impatiens glandulifera]|uniref:kinesin-like protein KIN-7N n=1 Tax=Impatiens glandulifera TaxID=253017 RepID=UPI001FB09E01|nr:kinesin-like protein KIN-7N [Impatiens glandulifera]
MEKICVAVRMRPPVSHEILNGVAYWKVEDNRISLHRSQGTPVSGASYAFDHVFDPNCTNQKVYELLTKDIVYAAIDGFNGTAFAYGQTSSGKTFTMNGSNNDPGIIHRAVVDIFKNIEMRTDREFLIRVSYMEIYNEEIKDLLAIENQKLQIHESLERGVFVAGLQEQIVNNAEQVLMLLQSGEVNRHFGETNMNARSSRSHTIFRMVLESKGKDSESDDAIRVSVLNLVDLAGSERIAKTGAGGVRLKEGTFINKSLMVLGNVINKLTDGGKQRAHIPFRDSKLTRILQPALGGNAKTSIICTLAPEEVHIEETKGTLQFASRAKRITNCVQVNEILTDAALLKRQKLEIEEMRKKLQGSRAEVLEQEILKLRNDMLKYELDHEKLAMELEEERKSQKERDQCIKEQQIKINNLSNLVTLPEPDNKSSQDNELAKENTKEESINSHGVLQEDAFNTPCFKARPNAFVARRSNYSLPRDCSPLPDTFSNFVDEDQWAQMNNGFVFDLDSINMTPARKVQSFPNVSATPGCSNLDSKQEIQSLKEQLEQTLKEKEELERHHQRQVKLNDELAQQLSELQKESVLTEKIPQHLLDSVRECKDVYQNVFSSLKGFIADDNSSTTKLLSSTGDVGISLFSTLETHLCEVMSENTVLIQEQTEILSDGLNGTITTTPLVSSSELSSTTNNPLSSLEYKDCNMERLKEKLKERLDIELVKGKERFQNLSKELETINDVLEDSRERYECLLRDLELLKGDKDTLLYKVSSLSETISTMTNEKENILQNLNSEVLKRKNLEDDVKHFNVDYACRWRSFQAFQSQLSSEIENLKAMKISVSKYLGQS